MIKKNPFINICVQHLHTIWVPINCAAHLNQNFVKFLGFGNINFTFNILFFLFKLYRFCEKYNSKGVVLNRSNYLAREQIFHLEIVVEIFGTTFQNPGIACLPQSCSSDQLPEGKVTRSQIRKVPNPEDRPDRCHSGWWRSERSDQPVHRHQYLQIKSNSKNDDVLKAKTTLLNK